MREKLHKSVKVTREMLLARGACETGVGRFGALLPAVLYTEPEKNMRTAGAMVAAMSEFYGFSPWAADWFAAVDACDYAHLVAEQAGAKIDAPDVGELATSSVDYDAALENRRSQDAARENRRSQAEYLISQYLAAAADAYLTARGK